jgi:hypothetical protein
MADLPSIFPGKIQVEETIFKAAVSESVMSRMGQAMNYLYDSFGAINFQHQEILASTSFTVPSGVTQLFIHGCGGGGGGGGEGGGTTKGSGGGSGRWDSFSLSVTPGQIISVVIGSGGSGGSNGINGAGGNDGSPSTFGSLNFAPGGGGLGGKTAYSGSFIPGGFGGGGSASLYGSSGGVGSPGHAQSGSNAVNTSAPANTGGGGGGADGGSAGNGGSGIIIVSWVSK